MRDGLPVLGRIALLATLLFTAQSVVLHAQSAIPLASNDAWLTELQRGQELDRQGKVAEAEEALVDAERLLLQGGGVVEGVIVSREGDSFLVKTDGNLQRVPKVRVRGIESGVRLPALDVYSREELYGLYLAETDTTSPDAQLALALRCESILDFVHASTHFEKALELGLTVDVEKVDV